MNRHVLDAAIVAFLFAAGEAAADEHGAEIFADACSTCHLETMSAEEADHAEDILAPPMNLLSTIIRKKTGDTKEAFIAHVVDFTREPAVAKVKAMKEAVDRFGLMPPIADIDPDLDENDLTAVAAWLFQRYDYDQELKELEEHEAQQAAEQQPAQ